MSDTPLLGLPLLSAAQAQKHVTHNEALLLLDAIIHLSVLSRALAAPSAAQDGERYLVAAAPTGAWAGQADKVALLQGGGWVFITPRTGWRLWVEDEAKLILFDGLAWREPFTSGNDGLENLPRLGINATADDTNRLAVSSAATLFTHAGSDHRCKLNKNAAEDTASLLFQTGWSGRAEMGLTGSDDFRINVSGDGAAWRPALVIDRASGAVSLPNTPQPLSVIHAQSLTTQGPGFAADTYLVGSGIAIPAGRLKPGTRYCVTFDVSKTAAGVAPPVITLRFGMNGSLADAARGAMTLLPQTAVADDGRFTLDVTFRSAGATAVVQAVAGLAHTLSASGLANAPGPVRRLTSAAFDATAMNAVIGVSVNAGAAAAWSVSLVQARLENMA